jgi:hypothetical protein
VIPTLKCILDRGVAEQIVERSVEVLTQDGFCSWLLLQVSLREEDQAIQAPVLQ